MFGGPVKCPKYPQKKPRAKETDILMPFSCHVGSYGHRGREPNTDYDKRLLHYKQRSEELFDSKNQDYQRSVDKEFTNIIHQNLAEKRRFKSKIQQRLKQKLEAYEADVDRRREKLRDLLCEEEQELIRETIHKHQNADVNKIEDRRKQCEIVRAQKEAERLELVRKKRLQQYATRSVQLRPFIAKKRLMESKDCQLQQMRENEAKRESERELDKLWLDVMKKHDEALLEREVQDALLKHEEHLKNKAILDMQVNAKKLLEEERKEIERSNRIEMQKLLERIAKEEKEDLKKKQEKSRMTQEDIKDQLRIQHEFEAQRKKEEQALDRALKELTELEVVKEATKVGNKTAVFKRETAMYREHIALLEQLRKEEEAKLDKLLLEVRAKDQKKKDEQQCKIEEARYKLQKQVLEGRAKQLECKKMQAEKKLQHKQEEIESMKIFIEKNRVLDEETKRLEVAAAKEYRQDLKKQIEYNNLLREREMRELEEKLRLGMEEEMRFREEVDILFEVKNMTAMHHIHPFRFRLTKPTVLSLLERIEPMLSSPTNRTHNSNNEAVLDVKLKMNQSKINIIKMPLLLSDKM